MAKFSFIVNAIKQDKLGIDKHNRRLNKNYISNPDMMRNEADKTAFILHRSTLYKDCKEQIESELWQVVAGTKQVIGFVRRYFYARRITT